MNITVGRLNVSIDTRKSLPTYPTCATAYGETPIGGPRIQASRRVAVELYHQVGGLPQRALLGGAVEPSNVEGSLTVSVLLSGAIELGPASVDGNFRKKLILGLPNDFGPAVLSGLFASAKGYGNVIIDRGAYDPEQSSASGYRLTASLLMMALVSHADEDLEPAMRRFIEASSH